jgi:molybdenum cofactor cytidylyltransferase
MEKDTRNKQDDLADTHLRFHTGSMSTKENTPAETWCVIPAAGASSRMGSWKPLLPWGSGTICTTVVDTVLSAGLRPVLVAGFRAGELAALFSQRANVLVVENKSWALGMLGSIQEGIRAVLSTDPDCNGVFVTLSDMPRVPFHAFLLVREEADRLDVAGKHSVVFAGKGGKLGHPVWIPMQALKTVLSLDPGGRLRDHLLSLPWMMVEVDDDGIHADIDTPGDYAAFMAGN